MGSKSSTSQQSKTQYTTETRNANVQENQGIALANAEGNTVNVLDGGAIEESFNLARLVTEKYDDTTADVLGFSKGVIAQSVDTVKDAFEQGRSSSNEDLFKIGALVTGGLVAVSLINK